MSLILEALNRSAKDRQAETGSPGLDTPVYTESPPEARTLKHYLPWMGLAVALLIIGALVYDRGASDEDGRDDRRSASVDSMESKQRQMTSSQAHTRLSEPVQKSVSSVSKPRDAVVPQTVQAIPAQPIPEPVSSAPPPPAAPEADAEVAALYGQQHPPEEEAGPVTPARAKEPAAPVDQQRETVQVEEVPEAPEESVTVEPIDVEEVLARTREELENTGLSEHSAPMLTDLSQVAKDEIPTLMYTGHDYSSNSAQSSVVINGKNLRVGGSPASGITVDEILTDSVVLSGAGQQFRLRALNSWINL